MKKASRIVDEESFDPRDLGGGRNKGSEHTKFRKHDSNRDGRKGQGSHRTDNSRRFESGASTFVFDPTQANLSRIRRGHEVGKPELEKTLGSSADGSDAGEGDNLSFSKSSFAEMTFSSTPDVRMDPKDSGWCGVVTYSKKDGKVYFLVQAYSPLGDVNRKTIRFPGGSVEEGELPARTAHRIMFWEVANDHRMSVEIRPRPVHYFSSRGDLQKPGWHHKVFFINDLVRGKVRNVEKVALKDGDILGAPTWVEVNDLLLTWLTSAPRSQKNIQHHIKAGLNTLQLLTIEDAEVRKNYKEVLVDYQIKFSQLIG